jgi:drug/metabolite transporter (DMT)-like permease
LPRTPSRLVATLLLLLIATTFSANHIAARLAFDHGVTVATAVTVRSLATALAVWLLMRVAGTRLMLDRRTGWRALAIGLLLTIQSYCLYSAVSRIPVALALLTFNTFPLVLAFVSWLAGAERPSRRTLGAMIAIVSGLVLALDVLGLAARPGDTSPAGMATGIAFGLGASVSFAVALFLTTRWLGRLDGLARTLLTMGTVGIATAAIAATQGLLAAPTDPTGWLGLALLSLLYGLAITGMFVLVPRLGAVKSSPILNFEPIAAMSLGWIVLGQRMGPTQIVGGLVVVSAIIYLSTARR